MGSGGSGIPQSWNRYAYVVRDPINSNDPSGLCWITGAFTGPSSTGCDISWVVANTGQNLTYSGGFDSTFDSYTAPPTGLSQVGTITQFDQGARDQVQYTSGYGAPAGTGNQYAYGQAN